MRILQTAVILGNEVVVIREKENGMGPQSDAGWGTLIDCDDNDDEVPVLIPSERPAHHTTPHYNSSSCR